MGNISSDQIFTEASNGENSAGDGVKQAVLQLTVFAGIVEENSAHDRTISK